MPKKKTSADCPKYGRCKAPLCPYDGNKMAAWFTDEPICPLEKFRKRHWVKKQRELRDAKIAPTSCFTIGMLEVLEEVDSNIKGLNPDIAGRTSEANWIRKYLNR